MIETLLRFPCAEDKTPLRNKWQERAAREHSPRWALVGVVTGERNGFDVLDVDPEGRSWYDQNFDAIPETRAHQTQRGVHLLFVHAPGLRSSAGKIAPGVDVRADGGFVIWWPREGFSVDDAPLAEWPDWLLAEAKGKRPAIGCVIRRKAASDSGAIRPPIPTEVGHPVRPV
jgi:Bifunctional DNA primase/polymerase, N-terminal